MGKVGRCHGRLSSREPDIMERKRARGTVTWGRMARARHHVSKQGSQLPDKQSHRNENKIGRERKGLRERERDRKRERERQTEREREPCKSPDVIVG